MLLNGSKLVLRANFIGIYLHGSLAAGDFNPDSSDVDFAVINKNEISVREIAELAKLNEKIVATGSRWGTLLEGAFIPVSLIKCYGDTHSQQPSISTGGTFGLDRKGIEEPIQRWVLREKGITLAGPDPKTFISPVTSDELRTATLEVLNSWWKPMLDDTRRLQDPEYQVYAVLTMCRMMYTLEFGIVVSKPQAAKWAVAKLDKKWSSLIEQALRWKLGSNFSHLSETLDFMKFYISQPYPAKKQS